MVFLSTASPNHDSLGEVDHSLLSKYFRLSTLMGQ